MSAASRKHRSLEGLQFATVAWFICTQCRRRVVVRQLLIGGGISGADLAELVFKRHGEPPICEDCIRRNHESVK